MFQQMWIDPSRVNLVCVDSYDEGVLKGRFYNNGSEGERFFSLSQFLMKMEEVLDRTKTPQSYTEPRTFSSFLQPDSVTQPSNSIRKGSQATFEIKVIFRQHSSWQGVIFWKERKLEYSFRSVLELVFLMDSALRCMV